MTNPTNEHREDEIGLLPCPLCGSTDLLLRDLAGWEIDCRGCELNLVLADDPSREGLIARWNIRSALSSRDAEAREVLERLQNLPSGDPPCWCRVRWQSGEHDGACEQAQTLFSKLQAPEQEEDFGPLDAEDF